MISNQSCGGDFVGQSHMAARAVTFSLQSHLRTFGQFHCSAGFAILCFVSVVCQRRRHHKRSHDMVHGVCALPMVLARTRVTHLATGVIHQYLYWKQHY